MVSMRVFKSGMTLTYLAAASLLWAIAFAAFQEYNWTSIESIGFAIVILCAAVGSAVMLYSLYEILKLKSIDR